LANAHPFHRNQIVRVAKINPRATTFKDRKAEVHYLSPVFNKIGIVGHIRGTEVDVEVGNISKTCYIDELEAVNVQGRR
jgi:hypothetical protein